MKKLFLLIAIVMIASIAMCQSDSIISYHDSHVFHVSEKTTSNNGVVKTKNVNLIVIVTEVNSDIIVTIYSTDNASYKTYICGLIDYESQLISLEYTTSKQQYVLEIVPWSEITITSTTGQVEYYR